VVKREAKGGGRVLDGVAIGCQAEGVQVSGDVITDVGTADGH
jgi:hypothetical protein